MDRYVKNYWNILRDLANDNVIIIEDDKISQTRISGKIIIDKELTGPTDNYLQIESTSTLKNENVTNIDSHDWLNDIVSIFNRQNRRISISTSNVKNLIHLEKLYNKAEIKYQIGHEQWMSLKNKNTLKNEVSPMFEQYILTTNQQIIEISNNMGIKIAESHLADELENCFTTGFADEYPLPESQYYINRFNPIKVKPFCKSILFSICFKYRNKFVACGSTAILNQMGYLHGDTTLPIARGQGLQKKLIETRKLICLKLGINKHNIYSFTEPYSGSNYNYQYNGFINNNVNNYIYEI